MRSCGCSLAFPESPTPSPGEGEAYLAKLLGEIGARQLTADDPCCAHCAGVDLDPAMPPADARSVLRSHRACSISILAYAIAHELQAGKRVEIEPRAGLPRMFVDGVEVDPLGDYVAEHCAACGEKASA